LPAMAEVQTKGMLDLPASSRASPLPQGYWVTTICVNDKKHCRSRLAGDGGGSDKGDAGSAGLIAGKPAPTGSACAAFIFQHQG
jgi:hypothetical protein